MKSAAALPPSFRQRSVSVSSRHRHPTVQMIAEPACAPTALDSQLGGNMSCSRVLTLFSLGVVLVGGEAGRLPTEPTSAAQTTLQPGGQPANSGVAERINVTGSWTWQETVESAIPPFIVEMIGQGIVPEGEITYLTCKGGGEMTLVQTGGTFEGTATQGGSCVTEGGQGPFWPPSFPPLLEATNGVISGKDISWTFNNCAYTAKVVGSGNRLVGQGACDIPLPLPYFLRTPNWRARR